MSTLFFLVIVTAIASGAIMLSTMQVKVASSIARWEASYMAAEGGINNAVGLIKYVHYDAFVPPQYCGILVEGCGLPGSPTPLVTEIQNTVHDPDAEDMQFQSFGYTVRVDVDPVGTGLQAGGGIEAAWAYHGGAYGSAIRRAYRITGEAATPTGSSRARIQQLLLLRAVM